jgi:S1-C subfamily serine protease
VQQPWARPPRLPERATRPKALRVAITAGIVGALVGGAIAGGIVAAIDDDTTIVREGTNGARPATALARPGDIRSILEQVQPAVVRVDAEGSVGTESGTGTGFIVDTSGVIVTNNHVVERASDIIVTLNDGDQVTGMIVGTAPAFDLAVLKIEHDNLTAIELGDSDQLQVGDAVIAIGNALALARGSGPTVTTGIVSGLGRDVQVSATEVLQNMVQTDAAINPGNSGGPLVDVEGRVIGINTAIANPRESNNIGFAIPISGALPIIEDLRAGRPAQAAFLGVSTIPLTPSMADDKGVAASAGALIVSVTGDSPAARAALARDDVIVEIEGKAVRSSTDVFGAVRRHRPGDVIDVVVVRGAERRTVKVTLASTSR